MSDHTKVPIQAVRVTGHRSARAPSRQHKEGATLGRCLQTEPVRV